MGLIDILTAGFQAVNRRPWIVLIPIALDLLFWAGPRLSSASVYQAGFGLLAEQVALAQERSPGLFTAEQQNQLQSQLEEARTIGGASFGLDNLTVFLAGPVIPGLAGPLERLIASPIPLTIAAAPIPSLLKPAAIAGIGPEIPVDNAVATIGVWLGLSLLNLPLAALYLVVLGRAVAPPGDAPFGRDYLRALLAVALWMGLSFAFLVGAILPLVFVAGLVFVIVPAAGAILSALVLAVPLWTRVYLYFWDAGVVVGRRTLWRSALDSVGLVRRNFLASLGLIALVYFILFGISAGLQRLAEFPVAVGLGIVVNAYIASGLVAAGLVFYRERVAGLATAPAVERA